jgi:ribose-phosphate pyrophosphokinase
MQVIEFPDGQVNVKFGPDDTPYARIRINSYRDLFVLKSFAEVARNHVDPDNPLKCFIPCLFGQRSDRRFDYDESFGLKIIADFINSCKFSSVEILHPHSDVSLALIDNSYATNLIDIMYWAISGVSSYGRENITLVSPDAGAYKWVFKIAEQFKLPLVAANKFRDHDGKISLNFNGDVAGKKCLILDDLCSRGGTFVALTKQLKEQGAKSVNLYVSHFEGGCGEYKQTIGRMLETIDGIYTTNSFREFDHHDLRLISVYDVMV